jgi:predicted ATP-grasp superfamily ATP-dependent carboligase
MSRILLLATTTGYQTRAFGEAAGQLGVDLVFATDRCHMIEDPWRDQAIPIRFHDEAAAVSAILASTALRPLDGILVVGDRPTVIGARAAHALGIPGHSAEAVAIARNKQRTRERLQAAGLPVPWFLATTIAVDPLNVARSIRYPAVVKPVALSGSRGVMRVDDPDALLAAFSRLRTLLQSPDIRAERNDAHDSVLVEGFIPGREYALEGLLHHGVLHVLALFDKPDPLDGPFFEETIYLTPSAATSSESAAIVDAVTRAVSAIGLQHGPVHAECRVSDDGVYVLEVAARPIGGLCARALRFEKRGRESLPAQSAVSLEELLLRHALGESPDKWGRESFASGVMMIPIPHRGIFRRADGVDEARAVAGIADVNVTAKPDQLLIPLPEGASYLGFIFARADQPGEVDRALRTAHRRLRFAIDPEIRLLARD